MTALVIAEHCNSALKRGTLHAVAAAERIGGDIHVLVAGWRPEPAAAAVAAAPTVAQVVQVDAAHLEDATAEEVAETALGIVRAGGYSHVLLAASSFGKSVAPRLAALLDVAQISDVVGIEAPDTFVRPMHAGEVLATVRSTDRVKVITVRPTAFPEAAGAGGAAPIERMEASASMALARVIGREQRNAGDRDLASARVVVAGGRGVGSAEGFAMLEDLAARLGGSRAASRAAVDAGYAANDLQVGQSGKTVAPDLYIAIGISGAIQHLAGMKDSKVIVAINKDPEAPIFQVADYGLVGDLFEVVPALLAALGAKGG